MKLKAGTKSTKKNNLPIENISKGGIGHDIKNSYINSLYMRSSAFTLYLITGLLAYAHKIPYLGRIVSLLGLWYGKTTIWKILVSLRKAFILLNALIGAILVFKTVGFTSDNLIMGLYCMGETYMQALGSIFKRVFIWFVELFDHKVIPTVPGDNGGTWFSKPRLPEGKSIFTPSNLNVPNILENDTFSLRNLYKSASVDTTPWYKDTTTWLWIGGIAITVGVLYLGYQFVANPTYILDLFKSTPSINTQGPTPPADPSSSNLPPVSPDISLRGRIGDSITGFSKSLVNTYKSTLNMLNPFTYLVPTSELQSQINLFMEVQSDYNRADRNLYPFTDVNPFDSYFKKFRLHYFGESSQEFIERTQLRMYADRIYESLKISKGKAIEIGGATPIFSSVNSPIISTSTTPATVLGLHPTITSIVDTINTATVERKLSSLSPTPSVLGTSEWVNHSVDKSTEAYDEYFRRMKNLKKLSSVAEPSSYSSVNNKPFNIYNFQSDISIEELSDNISNIDTHKNKLSVLSVAEPELV
jgi:hypothetical protein